MCDLVNGLSLILLISEDEKISQKEVGRRQKRQKSTTNNVRKHLFVLFFIWVIKSWRSRNIKLNLIRTWKSVTYYHLFAIYTCISNAINNNNCNDYWNQIRDGKILFSAFYFLKTYYRIFCGRLFSDFMILKRKSFSVKQNQIGCYLMNLVSMQQSGKIRKATESKAKWFFLTSFVLVNSSITVYHIKGLIFWTSVFSSNEK